ncbi:hypothetical protein FFB58_01900 [Enterobacter sp. MF024]|nr:hypothetical protein FFB58_01900 [Enterobacter sp. MF024]
MSVQKNVCLCFSPGGEGKLCALFFVVQALKPFIRSLARIIRLKMRKRKMKTAFQKFYMQFHKGLLSRR